MKERQEGETESVSENVGEGRGSMDRDILDAASHLTATQRQRLVGLLLEIATEPEPSARLALASDAAKYLSSPGPVA